MQLHRTLQQLHLAMLFALCGCPIPFVAAEDFDLRPVSEEQAAIVKIGILGGRCEIDDSRRVSSVNLAYSFSPLGKRISNRKLDSDAACEILTSFPWLQELSLSQSQISDEGLRHIGKLTFLREIKILASRYGSRRGEPTISDVGIQHLAGLKKLEVFHAPNTRLTDASLKVFGAFETLRELDLRGCPITDAGLQQLSDLRHLQVLQLGAANITARGLARITQNPIRSLFLYDCQIDDAALAELKKLERLEDLWIGRARITDAGIKHLADLNLVQLGLADTRLTDDAADSLGRITSLRRLLISGTQMTEASLPALLKLQNLESVSLSKYFQEDAKTQLLTANPKLEISGHWTWQIFEDLKRIGDALREYREVNGAFPPAAICDEFGEPLYSWRVAILPFLGEQSLFDRFRLDQPWNSDHNLSLLDEIPDVYTCKKDSFGRTQAGHTLYQALVGEDTIIQATEPADDIADQARRRAIVMETDSHQAVFWTAPHDFDLSRDITSIDELFLDNGLLFLLFHSGEVTFLRENIKLSDLERLIERD